MISRWKAPPLARGIALTAGVLPPSTHKALSRAYEDKEKEKPLQEAASKPSIDPWAPIFDDISSTVPPIHSPRPHLPPRFFTSRPSPKTFFTSNTPRGSSSSGSGRRDYATDASDRGFPQPASTQSHETVSAWDRIFDGVDGEPSVGRPGSRGALPSSAFSSARRPKRSRPTMTAREISAFDNMFDMIFTAVSDKRRESFTTAAVQVQPTSARTHHVYSEPSPSVSSSTVASSSSAPPELESTTSTASQTIGPSPPGVALDLFGKLRRQSNRMRRTSATAELLDRQKEEVELCETDQQLLEWAVREVFQSDHVSDAPDAETPSSSPASPSSPSPPSSSSSTSSSPSRPSGELARYLASPTYPHLLAHVMRTFRTKYHDPHTALALFAHAKRRSVHSYVFGCTTVAYNELLEARWELDGALKGVEEALMEMRANGLRADKATRAFVERVRREVGERYLAWQGSEFDHGMWDMLERVEALVASKKKVERDGAADGRKESRLDAKKRHWGEEWKSADRGKFKLGEDRLSLA